MAVSRLTVAAGTAGPEGREIRRQPETIYQTLGLIAKQFPAGC
jgi:hypothetical protein